MTTKEAIITFVMSSALGFIMTMTLAKELAL